MIKPTLLILAAGMGSRYGGLKQLDEVGPSNETIIDYSVYDAYKSGYRKVVFVIRESFSKDFQQSISDKFRPAMDVRLVYQSTATGFDDLPAPAERVKPWGTGHAILCAKNEIEEPFVAINADDFYGADAFRKSFDFLCKGVSETQYAMIGYRLENTLSPHGHVNRGVCSTDQQNKLRGVEELLEIERRNSAISYLKNDARYTLTGKETVSMNFWAFHPSLFSELTERFRQFLKTSMHEPKSEFYIPFLVNELINEKKVSVEVITSEDQWYGVTYQEDKTAVVKAIDCMTLQGKYESPLPFEHS